MSGSENGSRFENTTVENLSGLKGEFCIYPFLPTPNNESFLGLKLFHPSPVSARGGLLGTNGYGRTNFGRGEEEGEKGGEEKNTSIFDAREEREKKRRGERERESFSAVGGDTKWERRQAGKASRAGEKKEEEEGGGGQTSVPTIGSSPGETGCNIVKCYMIASKRFKVPHSLIILEQVQEGNAITVCSNRNRQPSFKFAFLCTYVLLHLVHYNIRNVGTICQFVLVVSVASFSRGSNAQSWYQKCQIWSLFTVSRKFKCQTVNTVDKILMLNNK